MINLNDNKILIYIGIGILIFFIINYFYINSCIESSINELKKKSKKTKKNKSIIKNNNINKNENINYKEKENIENEYEGNIDIESYYDPIGSDDEGELDYSLIDEKNIN